MAFVIFAQPLPGDKAVAMETCESLVVLIELSVCTKILLQECKFFLLCCFFPPSLSFLKKVLERSKRGLLAVPGYVLPSIPRRFQQKALDL